MLKLIPNRCSLRQKLGATHNPVHTPLIKIQSWTRSRSSSSHLLHQSRSSHQTHTIDSESDHNGKVQLQQLRKYSKKSDHEGFFTRATNFLTDTSEESLNKVYTERRLMGYSMKQMFDVVLDIAAYEKFLPWCKSSVVQDERPNLIIAKMSIGIPPLTEKYISEVKYSRPNIIIAESKKGHLFSHLVNNWKFSPGLKSHPNSCVVDFSVSFQFKSSITAKLGNVFFDETAKVMTSAFYNEAKRRYGKESVPSMKIKIVSKDGKENKPS